MRRFTENVRKKTVRNIQALVVAAGVAMSLTACGGEAAGSISQMSVIPVGEEAAAYDTKAGDESGADGVETASAYNGTEGSGASGGNGGLKLLCKQVDEGCHTQNGYYYIEKVATELTDGSAGARLLYMDFETLQEVFLCSNAGCGHNSPDCPSVLSRDDFGFYTLLFTYQGSLYLFSKAQDNDGTARSEFVEVESAGGMNTEGTSSVLYRADLDGTNREKVYTFDASVTVEDYVCGDENGLYMVTKKLTSNQEGVSTYFHSEERRLVFLDPDKGELSEICSMDFGGNVSWSVVSCYGRNLVLQGTDYGRIISDEEMFSDDDYPELYKDSSEVFACLNIDSGQLTEKYRMSNKGDRSFVIQENILYCSLKEGGIIKEINLDTKEERNVYSEPGSFYQVCSIIGEKLCCADFGENWDHTYSYIDRNTGEISHSGLVNKTLGWDLDFKAVLEKDVLVVYDYEATSSWGGSYEITLYQHGLISQEDLFVGNDNFRKINMVGKGW